MDIKEIFEEAFNELYEVMAEEMSAPHELHYSVTSVALDIKHILSGSLYSQKSGRPLMKRMEEEGKVKA